MRRRSERKKSTDVSSPALASRRISRRSRKSPSASETENNVDESPTRLPANVNDSEDNARASSEERSNKPVRRNTTRGARKRSPPSSPVKRRNQRADSSETKVETIPEEEDKEVPESSDREDNPVQTESALTNTTDELKIEELKEVCKNEKEKSIADDVTSLKTEEVENLGLANTEQTIDNKDVSETVALTESSSNNEESESQCNTDINMKEKQETEITQENRQKSPIIDKNVDAICEQPQDKLTAENNDESEDVVAENADEIVTSTSDKELTDVKTSQLDNNKITKKRKLLTRKCFDGKDTNTATNNAIENKSTRKNKWVTKSKEPTLAISTDSLKNLIADVPLVPLSDVKLESSSDVNETDSEREEGENSPTPERVVRRVSVEKNDKTVKKNITEISNSHNNTVITVSANVTTVNNATAHGLTNVSTAPVNRSPSPAKNETSCILYITNLVRPFTVLQLKGLLARTGKIVEDGFWMDRIKSKCYVQYETADEAIETRHALHGVRWPVSNPKCLHVEFGCKEDMQHAIESTKEDPPKFGQENNKDNVIIGSGWGRERNETDEKKNAKPVREWDVGKKESSEREKKRERERDRERDRGEKRPGREREPSAGNRENERTQRLRGKERSHSHSPARKIKKKENDPPLRLLDDLFRKTKAAPCIYWLPLTPEQIAEKEAFRLKRIEEHKERVKQRELERQKERERERERHRINDRERERENRRNRSPERRRSRSRDRRRY